MPLLHRESAPCYPPEYEQYFEMYYTSILKSCYVQLNYDRALACDCCQDVFLLFLRKQPVFKDPSGAKVWLYRAAKHRIRQSYALQQQERSRFDHYQSVTQLEQYPQMAYEPNFDQMFDLLPSIIAFRDTVLASLKAKDRQLYEWFYVEHLSCKAIAERMGITENYVWQKLYRLRKHILKEVKRLGLS